MAWLADNPPEVGPLFFGGGSVITSLSFVSQPQSKTVDEYSLATFSCEVTGGVAPYSYQYKKNGVNVGANSAALSFAAAAADKNASVVVTVTDSAGAAITSSAATLGVTSYVYQLDGLTQGELLGTPVTFLSGDSLLFKVKAPTSFVSEASLCHGVDGSAVGPVYVDVLSGGVLSTSSGVSLLVDGVSSSVLPLDGAIHEITVLFSATLQLGVFGCHRGLATRFFRGAVFGASTTRAAGNFSLPLNNKSQGANQLATVGSINATIINYNAAGWVAI